MRTLYEGVRPPKYPLATQIIRPLEGRLPRDWAFVLGVMVVGLLVRAVPVVTHAFPLGDGGMFYAMTQDLIRHHLTIPVFTTYNGGHIPFAYPPVGLYAVAIMHLMTGASTLELFRFFPLGCSILSIGAFSRLAYGFFGRTAAWAASTAAFALLPDSFYYETTGGGVTRGPGLLFSLLALSSVVAVCRSNKWRRVPMLAVLSAATAASHLEFAWFLAYSVPAIYAWLVRRGERLGVLVKLCAAGGVSLVMTSPWYVSVLSHHGLAVFMSAASGNGAVWPWYGRIVELISLQLVNEPWLPLVTVTALLGALWCLRHGDYLLPTWLMVAILAEARVAAFRVVIIVALLLGVAFARVVWPLIPPKAAPIVLAFLCLRGLMGVAVFELQHDQSLSGYALATTGWAASRTPHDARFVIITSLPWASDDVGEWFPALSRRVSVATVQGTEWLHGMFGAAYRRDIQLQDCSEATVRCLAAWARRWHIRYDYVYLALSPSHGALAPPGSDCCDVLAASLFRDRADFRLAYQNPKALVFAARR